MSLDSNFKRTQAETVECPKCLKKRTYFFFQGLEGGIVVHGLHLKRMLLKLTLLIVAYSYLSFFSEWNNFLMG